MLELPFLAPPALMPTARDTVFVDGPAQLFHFRPEPGAKPSKAPPVLLIPSMINRWYVLDLREGASVATALTKAGLDVYCLDWGDCPPEDRHVTWEDVLARLGRMVRKVRRLTGSSHVTILGYCMGATLSSIHCALEPKGISGLVNLLGPIDFSHAGALGVMTLPENFDVDAIADAGNVAPQQMQAGFQMLRPTATLAKMVGWLDRAHDPAFREGYDALEAWASDNVAFPAAAYRTYIKELYQQNNLVHGRHHVGGRRVDLKNITCPVMTVVAERDTICPPKAAFGLHDLVPEARRTLVSVPGGHVGAVVGGKAATSLYPSLIDWMKERTCS